MAEARVTVTLKKSILDPQGSAVEKSLRQLGYPVESVRIGKYMEVKLQAGAGSEVLEEICQRVLANPVIEEFSYTWEEEQ
jgi:phosphoribosylformylglycinamidine synthase